MTSTSLSRVVRDEATTNEKEKEKMHQKHWRMWARWCGLYRFIISCCCCCHQDVFKIFSTFFPLLFLSIISRPSFRIGRERRKLQLTGVNASLNIKRIILLVPKQTEGGETKQKKNDFDAAAAAVAIRTHRATQSTVEKRSQYFYCDMENACRAIRQKMNGNIMDLQYVFFVAFVFLQYYFSLDFFPLLLLRRIRSSTTIWAIPFFILCDSSDKVENHVRRQICFDL